MLRPQLCIDWVTLSSLEERFIAGLSFEGFLSISRVYPSVIEAASILLVVIYLWGLRSTYCVDTGALFTGFFLILYDNGYAYR